MPPLQELLKRHGKDLGIKLRISLRLITAEVILGLLALTFKGITDTLCRMVVAAKLNGSRMTFPRIEDADFVDQGICALTMRNLWLSLIYSENDEYYWKMEEFLVINTLEEQLQKVDIDAEFEESLRALDSVLSTLGTSSSSKGNAIEPILRHTLKSWNGHKLAELPFLRELKLPLWCDDFYQGNWHSSPRRDSKVLR